jgi:hypothetical protein
MKVFNTKLALWSIVALASLMLLLVLQLYFNQPSVYFNWKTQHGFLCWFRHVNDQCI